jgi:hypothetical protein
VAERGIQSKLASFVLAALVAALSFAPARAAQDSEGIWGALVEGGHVALVRHGNAPGPSVDRIQSSPWCRCMETARLMGVGPVEVSWALVPATDRNPNAPAALAALKDMVANWRGPGTLVLVTHGLTVRSLTGTVPSQAEIVVLKPTPVSGSGAHSAGSRHLSSDMGPDAAPHATRHWCPGW